MKLRILTILAIAGVLFSATDSRAFLSVSVTANPFVTPGYDINATTSGVVEYYILNKSSSTSFLDQLYLNFESDVFTSFSTSTPGFSVSGMQIVGTGLSLAPGESITLTVNYTLSGPAAILDWDEGGPWEQGWAALGTDPMYFTGGSTSLTPEPNTLLLLGAGLFGLGARARRRKKHRQKAS